MSSEKRESENKNVESQGAGSQNREFCNQKSDRLGKPYYKQNRPNRENRDGENSRQSRRGKKGDGGRNREYGKDAERGTRYARSRDTERGGKSFRSDEGENQTEALTSQNGSGEVVAGFYSIDQIPAEKTVNVKKETVPSSPVNAQLVEDTAAPSGAEEDMQSAAPEADVSNQEQQKVSVQSQESALNKEAEQEAPEQNTAEAGASTETASEKIEVIGVRFRQAGKIYYFDPSGFDIEEKSHVIVETARGVEYGLVVLGRRAVQADKVIQPLKPVIRVATPEDEDRNQQNREKEKSAFKICKEKIIKHGLEMKLIDCEYTFDNNKVLFYFTADGRIDFRELVKDLAAIFKTRIELRQIGVRDETKICGGIGMCGRPLCCHTYLSEFIPVSIKMAKDQNLSLNPVKISGICGRLMCCLKNEEETYEWLNSKLPNEGDTVTTPEGLRGEVQTVNVLRQLVKVVITTDNDEKEVREYPVTELKFKTRRRRGDDKIHDAELRALENLEKKENKSKL